MPPRSTSSDDGSSPGWPSVARCTLPNRSPALAIGAAVRCGGVAFGISQTSFRPATSSSCRAAARCPLCTGSNVPPMMPIVRESPSPLGGDGRGGGSAFGIIEKFHLGNPHRLPAPCAVFRERVVQPPAVEHALKMRQALGVRHVGHGQQPLQLIPGHSEPALDRLDGKGLGGAGTPVYLERGQRLGLGLVAPPPRA